MALAGLKVLDFTHLLPGEVCSTLLADMGADVLRIERLEPTLNEMLPPHVDGESLYFWSLHRNKKRLRVNLKSSSGHNLVRRLAEQADIIIENFRPSAMDRLGLGAKELMEANPRLIYCSISGYGSQSQWSDRPGHDLNFVAETGILHETRSEEGIPVMPAVFVSDYMSGTYAALAISAALYERTSTGRGRRLEISMFESALSALAVTGTMGLYLNMDPADIHVRYPDALPNHRLYKCADGRYLAAAPVEPQFWTRFLALIGRDELQVYDVIKDRDYLSAEIAATIAGRSLSQWMTVFAESNCCVSPVNKVSEATNFLPGQESAGLITTMPHDKLGPVRQISNPIKKLFWPADKPNWSITDPAQAAGALLRQEGFTEAEIEELGYASAVADGPANR